MKQRKVHNPITRIVRGSVRRRDGTFEEGWWVSSDRRETFADGEVYFSTPEGPFRSREVAERRHRLLACKQRRGESQNYERVWPAGFDEPKRTRRTMRPVMRNLIQRKQVEHLTIIRIR